MSLGASGSFAKTLVASNWKKRPYLSVIHKPGGSPSLAQLAVREQFTLAKNSWNELDSESKEEYNERAKVLRITGYNLFIKEFEGDMLKSIKIVLTDDQIKNLAVTPVEILPIPSAGVLIIPISAFLLADVQNGIYGNLEDGASWVLENTEGIPLFTKLTYDSYDGIHGLDNLIADGATKNEVILSAGQLESGWGVGSQVVVSNAFTKQNLDSIGKGVQIRYVTEGGNILNGGNPANTLTIVMLYSEVTI